MDKVIADLPEILPNTDHFEFYWFPHTNKCQTVRRHSVKQSKFTEVGKRRTVSNFLRCTLK